MPYILVTAIYIVSTFQVPLGQPIMNRYIYPNKELCEQYGAAFLQPYMNGPLRISIEYNAFAQAKCFTPEEFEQTFGAPAIPIDPPAPNPLE